MARNRHKKKLKRFLLTCARCGGMSIKDTQKIEDIFDPKNEVPLCPRCGHVLRIFEIRGDENEK